MSFKTKNLNPEPDYNAPDGSLIYTLLDMKGGGLCICEIPQGFITQAVYHKTVEEIWYIMSGQGQIWRKLQDKFEITEVTKGTCITIPKSCHFQFRNTGKIILRILIATMPPWPGKDEAVNVDGYWE